MEQDDVMWKELAALSWALGMILSTKDDIVDVARDPTMEIRIDDVSDDLALRTICTCPECERIRLEN